MTYHIQQCGLGVRALPWQFQCLLVAYWFTVLVILELSQLFCKLFWDPLWGAEYLLPVQVEAQLLFPWLLYNWEFSALSQVWKGMEEETKVEGG